MALLCFQGAATLAGRQDLERAAQRYWDALAEGDKLRAMQFVHPDDLNKFLKRNEPAIADLAIDKILAVSEGEAEVIVSFRRQFPGGQSFSVQATETWVLLDSQWKVRVESEDDLRRRLTQKLQRQKDLPARLDVFPQKMKFYAGSDQPGVIVIRNGLGTPVQVVGLDFDESIFEIVQPLDAVPSGSVGRIALSYRGAPGPPNQEGHLRLHLEIAGELRDFEIPLVYNFRDPRLDWLRKRKPPDPEPPRPEGLD